VFAVSAEATDAESLAEPGSAPAPASVGDAAADAHAAADRDAVAEVEAEAEAEPPHPRRPRPTGARCDACHERGSRVVRSRDALLTVCTRCARGAEVANNDSADAITAVVNRAPIGERRVLMRRLLARRALHTARRDRKTRPSVSS
jgi:hypothetical protein